MIASLAATTEGSARATSGGGRLGRFGLPLALLLSGFCGISYEILYTKLLGNLLGNTFVISASVLLTFLLGIGIGTLLAHRFVRSLWLIEAGIGLYAACFVGAYGWIDRLLYGSLPVLGTSAVACALVSIVLLVVPAFLVGCSVPLFAAYLGSLGTRHVFAVTYAIYNVGAALTALGMEFVVLRLVGLHAATLGLALLNGLVAVTLLAFVRSRPAVAAPSGPPLQAAPRALAALGLAGVASAIFQLLMIKIAECIFGPFNETFSLVLATVLLGLAAGAALAGGVGLRLSGALLLALCGPVVLLLGLPAAVSLYASAYPEVVASYPALVAAKQGLVLLLMALPAIGFGATIPTLIRRHRDVALESGRLLFVASMGNVLGFVAMAFVLHRALDYGPLLLVVGGITLVALLVDDGRRPATAAAGVALLALAFVGWRATWDEMVLYYGHTAFHSSSELERARGAHGWAERFKGAQDVFAITHRGDESYFFINGYVSINLNNVSEKLVGAISSMLAPRTDRALVLGIGSGATASAVGAVFEQTDAVEINKVVIDNLDRMSRFNFDLPSMPGVRIVHDDGIHFVKAGDERYSLIVNTVTSPLYFSSSKLYTRDFLERVRERLTPDGVYTTWIDRKVGDEGIDIMLATLTDVFDACWLTYLKSSYYLMACSAEPIALRSYERVVASRRLADWMATEHGTAIEMIPYSVLVTDARRLVGDDGVPRNTLDHPVLEHVMARLDPRRRLRGFGERLAGELDREALHEALGDRVAWRLDGFVLWADLRLGHDSLLYGLIDAFAAREAGQPGDGYARQATEIAQRIGTPRAALDYGRQLYERGFLDEAATLLADAAADPALAGRALYYVGRSRERQGRLDEARSAYEAALARDPDSSRIVEALARFGT